MTEELTEQERVVLDRWRQLTPQWRDAIGMLLAVAINTMKRANGDGGHEWMTTSEVMEYTGYSRTGISHAVKSGALACHRQDGLKRNIRFRRDEVEDWLWGRARK